MKLKNGDAVIIYNDKEVNKRILLGKVMKSVNEHDEILPESSKIPPAYYKISLYEINLAPSNYYMWLKHGIAEETNKIISVDKSKNRGLYYLFLNENRLYNRKETDKNVFFDKIEPVEENNTESLKETINKLASKYFKTKVNEIYEV